MSLHVNFPSLPSGAVAKTITLQFTSSGSSSGVAKTVTAGKAVVITAVRLYQKTTSTTRLSQAKVLVNTFPIKTANADSSVPDLLSSTGERISNKLESLMTILEAGATYNVTIQNSSTVDECVAILEAYEYTP